MSQPSGPDIAVYPPAVSVAAPLCAVALEWLVPLGLLPRAGSVVILVPGLALLAASGWLAISGTRAFAAAGTNVDPKEPSLTLVREGPYRFTRNPMYLGMTLIYAGITIIAGCLLLAAMLVPILVTIHVGVIRREEAYMERKFGEPYRHYLATTRRWL